MIDRSIGSDQASPENQWKQEGLSSLAIGQSDALFPADVFAIIVSRNPWHSSRGESDAPLLIVEALTENDEPIYLNWLS